jgi:DNA repair exonuclease SbcCD ATPase subunit
MDTIAKVMEELEALESLPTNDENTKADMNLHVTRISSMLEDIKSQLLQANSAEFRRSRKLDFSPYSNKSPGGSSPSGAGGRSPSPGKSDILKTYMRNQLELQESEWESYEETINSLAEQLELKVQELEARDEAIQRLSDERDELASMTTNLGDRLKALGLEKYDLMLQKDQWMNQKQDMQNSINMLETSLQAKEHQLADINQVAWCFYTLFESQCTYHSSVPLIAISGGRAAGGRSA